MNMKTEKAIQYFRDEIKHVYKMNESQVRISEIFKIVINALTKGEDKHDTIMDMKIGEAISFCEREIESYKNAPIINGCEMTEDWKEKIEFYKTAIEALEEANEAKRAEEFRCDRQKDFEKAVKPVLEFLHKYGNPHCTIIITEAGAEFLIGEVGTSFELRD